MNDIYRLDDCINDGKQNISYSLFCSSAVSNEERKNMVRNNELCKTITIDINKLDRNLTILQNTSIFECAINATGQPVNDQNIIIIITNEQINEPESKKLVII